MTQKHIQTQVKYNFHRKLIIVGLYVQSRNGISERRYIKIITFLKFRSRTVLLNVRSVENLSRLHCTLCTLCYVKCLQ